MKNNALKSIGKKLGITGVCLILSLEVLAGESLEINGAFAGKAFPDGWAANKPNYWDEAGTLKLNKIPVIDKTAAQFTSQRKKMHIFTRKDYPVAKGDIITLKAVAKGKGSGLLGVYTYPAGGLLAREFRASAEWSEVVVKLETPSDKIKSVRVVTGVAPGASIEFMYLTAEIERGGLAQKTQKTQKTDGGNKK